MCGGLYADGELVNALTGLGDELTLTRPDYANSGVFLRKPAQE